jgi:outer membrane receptor protein involved in Fe transport
MTTNKCSFLLLLFLFPVFSVFAQQISGRVIDLKDTSAVPGAVVALYAVNDTNKVVAGTSTDVEGFFTIKSVARDTYGLRIMYVGISYSKVIVVNADTLDLGQVIVSTDDKLLGEVRITETMIRVQQKGDTTEINANAFKTNPDANAEDLVKKMPGVTVENGQVKAQGENVTKVTVDGKEYFGDDANAALKNLPAEVVDKVQIFDQRSDQSRFTGIDDGNTQKVMNIVTKSGKGNGEFGKFYAGYGTDDRYQAGVSYNNFKNARRVTLVGGSNNINQQNFSTQDFMGTSGGGGRGGGRGFSRGGNSSDFMQGKQNGLTVAHAAGINYSDSLGKSGIISASYFFNQTDNTVNTDLSRAFFSAENNGQTYVQNSLTGTVNTNHRASLRMEWNIDSMNTIVFAPRFSTQQSSYANSFSGVNALPSALISSLQNSQESDNFYWQLNGNLTFRRKFKKPGRTFTADIDGNVNERRGDGWLYSSNTFYRTVDSVEVLDQQSNTFSNAYSVSPTFTWTEKAGKKGMVSLTYNPTLSINRSDIETSNFDSLQNSYSSLDSILSNRFDNRTTVQSVGTDYRWSDEKRTINIGLRGQQTDLYSDQLFPNELSVHRTFRILLPTATFTYKVDKSMSIRVNYRTSTSLPSVSQLQNVINNTNPLSLSIGNPLLKQSYTHRVFSRISKSDSESGRSLFMMVMGSLNNNYIGNSIWVTGADTAVFGINVPAGGQLTIPVNISGYWSVMTFGVFSTPLKAIKSNVNINWGYTYNNSPGLVNGNRNITKNQILTGGVVVGSNVSEDIDFTLSWNGNYNIVQNLLLPQQNNNFFYHTSGAKFNIILMKKLVISGEGNYTVYTGLGSDFNDDFLLLNSSIAYKFLKKNAAEVKLTVFDILKQNTAINRTVNEMYIEDTRSDVLTQYFMLTFTYNLRKFSGKIPEEGAEGRPAGMPHRPH